MATQKKIALICKCGKLYATRMVFVGSTSTTRLRVRCPACRRNVEFAYSGIANTCTVLPG